MTEGAQRSMSKQAMLKQPYPLNMILNLLVATVLEVPELTDDVLAGLEYALSMLTDREREFCTNGIKNGKRILQSELPFM